MKLMSQRESLHPTVATRQLRGQGGERHCVPSKPRGQCRGHSQHASRSCIPGASRDVDRPQPTMLARYRPVSSSARCHTAPLREALVSPIRLAWLPLPLLQPSNAWPLPRLSSSLPPCLGPAYMHPPTTLLTSPPSHPLSLPHTPHGSNTVAGR